jgi:DNA polymerase II small subunit
LKLTELDLKKTVLLKLVDSGFNITPQSLEFILNLEKPSESINEIIKEVNFIPQFNGHITQEILSKLSNKEIRLALKRIINAEDFVNRPSLNDSIKIDESPSSPTKQLVSISEPLTETKFESPPAFSPIPFHSIPHPISPLKQKKEKEARIIPSESTKSSLHYNPIAKDYNFDYKILKDPTGKLFTSGEYEDFYELTIDKFNTLKNLMKKRPEVLSSTNISNILRLSSKNEVSVIGLVSNMHRSKNDNFIFSLEDLTGTISILIKNDPENQELVKVIKRTINDQMLYVEGIFNPPEKTNTGIIFANKISKIDIPTDFEPNKAHHPLNIALISDTHIGSKEFEEKLLKRFLDFLNGKIGNKQVREIAGKVKYLIINGDLVDGIGVYPNQQGDLVISDIYEQYEMAAAFIRQVPDYIKIFYVSGNHEPVRNAIPRPAVPKQYCKELYDLNVKNLGNPSLISTHGVKTLIYHGEGMHDMNMMIHGLDINQPVEAMKEFLICRHLSPIYGEKTQIAPTNKDHLVIDNIPDIFHTGHVHINDIGRYRNVTLVNSGCFQAQTDFMKSFGIEPTPGIVPIIELDTLKSLILDFKKDL